MQQANAAYAQANTAYSAANSIYYDTDFDAFSPTYEQHNGTGEDGKLFIGVNVGESTGYIIWATVDQNEPLPTYLRNNQGKSIEARSNTGITIKGIIEGTSSLGADRKQTNLSSTTRVPGNIGLRNGDIFTFGRPVTSGRLVNLESNLSSNLATLTSNINTVQSNVTSNVATVQSNLAAFATTANTAIVNATDQANLYAVASTTLLEGDGITFDKNDSSSTLTISATEVEASVSDVQANLEAFASTANTNTNSVQANLASYATTTNTAIDTVSSNTYAQAEIADLRAASANNLIVSPEVLSDWHTDQHRRTKFTGYNKTSNATVGVGEYKIDGSTVTIRPKADDVSSANAQSFLGQYFTAENGDRTSRFTAAISTKTFQENIITLTVRTPLIEDTETSSLGDNSTIFLEGEDRYNSRQDAFDFGDSGSSVEFATSAEVLAGTVTDKAVAPDTAHDLVENLVHVADYSGFTYQATLTNDGTNLAVGEFHINSSGDTAWFRGHNDTEGAKIKREFLVDKSVVMEKTGGRLDFDFSAVSIVDISGSDNDVIKCTITNHRSTPAIGLTLTGDWSIALLPAQNKKVFEKAPEGTIPAVALATMPGGQAKGLNQTGS